MDFTAQDAPAGRFSRRQALVASGAMLLACATLGSPASAAVGNQESWRFCSKCFSMFYDGAGFKGACPAGGAHTAQGFYFTPHYDDGKPETATIQYEWRFCSKCFAMFYNNGPRGKCPSGGVHTAQGFNFGLVHDGSPSSGQTEWRFCQQCFALFYNGGSFKGKCPAGGGHVAQGFVFSIPFHADAAAAPALPEYLAFDNNSITFDGGVPVGGNSHVVLHQDGRVEFKSHFHDSGAPDYWYSITWAMYATDGTVFRVHHRAKVIGHVIGSGQSDRNSDFDQTVTNGAITQHWPALVKANLARMSAHTAASIGGLIDTAEEAVKDIKTAVDDAEKLAQAGQTVYSTVSTVVDIIAG
jgi:hypothetical protein